MDSNLINSAKNKKLFPQKLWDLINDESYSFCLRWSDDGQLVYLNRDEFEESYLKTPENQFHTQKAISFVRQMNMYGFRKVDDCYYENDNFKRDCEHLLKNMVRKHPNKNTTSCGPGDLRTHLTMNAAAAAAGLGDYRQRLRLPASSPQRISTSGGAMCSFNQQQNGLENDCSNEEDSFSSSSEDHHYSTNTTANQQELHTANNFIQANKTTRSPDLPNYTGDNLLTNVDMSGSNNNSNNNNSTRMFYALLSSLNAANLYQTGQLPQPQQQQLQQQTQPQQQLGATQQTATATDLDHFVNLQQIYQHLLSGTSTTHANDNGLLGATAFQTPTSMIDQINTSSNCTSSPSFGYDQQAINYSSAAASSKSRNSSPRSILSNDPFKFDIDDSHVLARRDATVNSPSIRSFKRSANSILESISTPNKRNKNNFTRELNVDEVVTTSYARGLVTRIAHAKDSNIEANVIEEASKLTERFVETLFDTAQVIARLDGIEKEHSAIKPIDLTSAMRLMPTKLSKFLN